jgi:hypothetical protein
MQLTNKHNLPEPVFQAIANDTYTKGDADYSVTQLIQPVQMAKLTEGNGDQITEDAMDRVWTLFGKAMHKVLEAGAEHSDQPIYEERLSAIYVGKKVSGQLDYAWKKPETLDDGSSLYTLWDYKVTSVWSIIFEDGKPKPDWTTQMNWYANLAHWNDWEVFNLKILVILRDWSAGELRRRRERGKVDGYPETPIIVLDVPMLPRDQVTADIERRVALFETVTMDDLPECTPEERWQQNTVYAVHKKGVKKASKLFRCESHEDEDNQRRQAKLFIGAFANPLDYYLERRPGRSTRCEDYCLAAPYCKQFKAIKEAKS